MSQTQEGNYYPDDEIDLRELFVTLWRGKWLVIVTAFIFAVAGVAYALYKPNIYQSSVLLAPAQEEGGGIGGLASQFGGLASLAGISLGGGSSNQTVIAKEVLQSRAFITGFIHRHELAIAIKAVKGWNEETSDWVYDHSVYSPDTGEWLQDSDGKSQEPTDWELVEAFKEDHLDIGEAKDTGMITVSVKHYSPIAAKQWAQWLVQDINEHMRKQDVEEAEASITYLEDKLKETNIAGMQQVFYQLIEGETRTVMLASAQREYVFKIVDPAVVPEEKSAPKRALISVISTCLGGILGILIVFIRSFFVGSREA
ncbi:Wzz/FepE/Etk N-terminal domain-containing protein [Marinobacter sp.]|uniref:Wzz/FepE/Etk N-terminal domain-containing protein n=1 Tax=Marinobacter sp. TaxID=50741 RepID=UPI001B417D37|nr:Wzz/FepE/Etk N-terminal domain-containing protein [Marinobacter sp.]MBQ0831301.1 LPS O-antigen length regulator [Marinobacter sp.]